MERSRDGRTKDRKHGDEQRRKHDEQVEFRGVLGDACSNAESHAKHPELCGTEEPIVDEQGRPLRPERYNQNVTDRD